MRRNSFFAKYSVCLIWLCGFALGMGIATQCSIDFQTSDRVDCSAASIFLSALIPVGIAYFSFQYGKRLLLRIVLFIKAFLYGYCMFMLCLLQNGNGLFLLGVRLFSGSCTSAFVVFWALEDMQTLRKKHYAMLLSVLIVCFMDYLLFGVLFRH